jgi:hypothetical protein
MSEDPSSGGGSDDGGYDGLMDDKDEKELMVECGQRQVRPATNLLLLSVVCRGMDLLWLGAMVQRWLCQ